MKMIKNKLKDGFIIGSGFGLGLLFIMGIFYGVYAFVEPSSNPTNDYVLNWNSPLNALHSDTNSRVEGLSGTTANSGMYDNRIPVNFNPSNDYTMICFKGGSTLNDQMDGGDSTNDGVNCEPGDIGFIIEADERSALHWENAKAVCLENEMRLPESFEFKYSCNNAGSFGLTGMTGNWEWASNFALPMYGGDGGVAATIMGLSGCASASWYWVGYATGIQTSTAFRCVK